MTTVYIGVIFGQHMHDYLTCDMWEVEAVFGKLLVRYLLQEM